MRVPSGVPLRVRRPRPRVATLQLYTKSTAAANYPTSPTATINGRLGTYLRTGLAIGYDARGVDHRAGERWRGDAIARVTLDPFREQRWGFSFGGGVRHRGSSTYRAALLELEGPEMFGVLPALQAGVSGGLRGGLILRRAVRGRR